MHDLNGTTTELNGEYDETSFELNDGEYDEAEADETLDEADEMALAAELMSTATEEELDHFLGGLIKSAVSKLGKVVGAGSRASLGGILKAAAKHALPALANAAVPGSGAALAQVGNAFGLETEVLDSEDREYEEARAFVRFADAAARELAQTPPSVPAPQAARAAATTAAQQHAPGLLRAQLPPRAAPPQGRGMTGRWFRRGNKIVIVGV